jgi:hypothetical protein
MMQVPYYGGALPQGVYVRDNDGALWLFTVDGQERAEAILTPPPGVSSAHPGNAANIARLRIRRALKIDIGCQTIV